MPIYDFQCSACGHRDEIMRKIADPAVTSCPACGASDTFSKMLSAAGFQLKGSGWYATDFKGGGNAKPASTSAAADAAPAPACGSGACGHQH
ncbi:FmdB family zinc ribbon protein [Chitinimonas sp.]|uniref:FmdB family zinc ribbon protein n=1 Tax=Chitinimonas sp. TaxID=1934313 RepID=UPI0035B28C70